MEPINAVRVHDAIIVFMDSGLHVKDAKAILKRAGATEHEIDLAHKMACRNVFHFAFSREWSPEGGIQMVPEVIGEA